MRRLRRLWDEHKGVMMILVWLELAWFVPAWILEDRLCPASKAEIPFVPDWIISLVGLCFIPRFDLI